MWLWPSGFVLGRLVSLYYLNFVDMTSLPETEITLSPLHVASSMKYIVNAK